MDLFFVLTYLLLRFGATPWLDSFGGWSTYVLEAIFVAVAFVRYHKALRRPWHVPRVLWGLAGLATVAGALAALGARWENFPMPFDLHTGPGLLTFLLLGPALEEAIFRFFLWQPARRWAGDAGALVLTSLLFSYAHWHPGWWVPQEWHGFLFYQALYTLGLGLACGMVVWRRGSLGGAILVHVGFNLGFWFLTGF